MTILEVNASVIKKKKNKDTTTILTIPSILIQEIKKETALAKAGSEDYPFEKIRSLRVWNKDIIRNMVETYCSKCNKSGALKGFRPDRSYPTKAKRSIRIYEKDKNTFKNIADNWNISLTEAVRRVMYVHRKFKRERQREREEKALADYLLSQGFQTGE
tara:strand:- start:1476 stop:1952 length:477 start_codon:yes stop_codon:yes gene_type:complete